MNATTEADSASGTRRGDEVLGWAGALYARLASGHDGLAYNVDPRGAALTIREVDEEGRPGPRRPVYGGGGDVPPWRRARELRDVRAVREDERAGARRVWVREGHLKRYASAGQGGAWVCLEMGEEAARRFCIDIGAELFVEVDRRFNPHVLAQHVRGRYSLAFAAPAWVEWVCLDLDAHPRAGETPREARKRAERMLARIWRALGCSAARHPIVWRSPGGGFHAWFPLTRGATSANPEHTWPAAVARAWFERHLVAAGVELAAGDVEVFPSGRALRAPCGPGMVLLRPERPDDPDDLRLAPWPGTMRSERVDWRDVRAELSSPARNVAAMIRTFVEAWDAQRRTPADWLGRPEASWDRVWGPLGWRDDAAAEALAAIGAAAVATSPAPSAREKNPTAEGQGKSGRSQESDDEPGGPPRMRREVGGGEGVRSGRSRERQSGRSGSPSSPRRSSTPAAREPDLPPESAGGLLLKGRAFREKVAELLAHGVTRPSSRWDALHTLTFYWMVTCGRPELVALALVERWLRAHAHGGSRLASDPHKLIAESLREARSMTARLDAWLTAHPERRGNGDAGGLGTLAFADQVVLAAVDPRVVDEVTVVLAWLAGRAGAEGTIAEPVQIATGLLARLCGDRRVVVDGRRRRASTLAIAELVRLGVLTLASEYVVGRRGRAWSCWYRFGSGELPRAIELPRATWDEAAPAWERVATATEESVPAAPIAVEAPAALELAPTPAPIAPAAELRQESPREASVVVRVVGERVLREGLLRIVSDGSRARPRAVLELAADARPTATPAARSPWFVRAYRGRVITPADLAALPAEGLAKVIPFPDVEARRRLTRRERIALGTGELAPVVALAPRPARPAVAASAERASPPAPAGARAELAAEVGAVAFELPLDVAEVAALAWRSFSRR